MISRTLAYRQFNEEYAKIKESDKTLMSKIVNKLLQVNYLTNKKPGELNDYTFAVGNRRLLEGFFALMDFSFNVERADEVVYIKNESVYNHLNLNKTNSIMILVIRILYQRKQTLITLGENVEIVLEEIHDELTRIGYLNNNRITKTELVPALIFLRRYNIIDYVDRSLQDNARIKVYPTIMYITNMGEIEAVINKYDTYHHDGGARLNEEINEN